MATSSSSCSSLCSSHPCMHPHLHSRSQHTPISLASPVALLRRIPAMTETSFCSSSISCISNSVASHVLTHSSSRSVPRPAPTACIHSRTHPRDARAHASSRSQCLRHTSPWPRAEQTLELEVSASASLRTPRTTPPPISAALPSACGRDGLRLARRCRHPGPL